MKTSFKVGQKVYWQEEEGDVVMRQNDNNYPLLVRFKWDVESFTEDGRIDADTPPVLSHTPYTLNGFSQVQEIEKDTLVYVRDTKNDEWVIKYYSHFENGYHWCFNKQKKSTETDVTISWKYCQVESPF